MKNKLSILVIDDETSLGNVYTTFLGKIGAEVIYCDHPQKGWREIEKHTFDLIITDLKMPVITGDEFISIVRSSKLNIHKPIILCSGYINKLVVTEMARESKIYFLAKPFDSKGLLDLVGKALGVKQSNEAGIQALNEKWLQAWTTNLGNITAEKIETNKINQFEVWNFESISLNYFVANESEILNITMLMKSKTFLKIAGVIQGTQYKEIESETLSVWQELLKKVYQGTGRVTFSKLLRQEIITQHGHVSEFYKFNTTSGEILTYLN